MHGRFERSRPKLTWSAPLLLIGGLRPPGFGHSSWEVGAKVARQLVPTFSAIISSTYLLGKRQSVVPEYVILFPFFGWSRDTTTESLVSSGQALRCCLCAAQAPLLQRLLTEEHY